MKEVKTIVLSEAFFYKQAAKAVALVAVAAVMGGAAIAVSSQYHDWQRVFLYVNVACMAWIVVKLVEFVQATYGLWRMWYDVQKQVRQDMFMREIVEAIKDGRINENGECNCPKCRAGRGENN